MKRDAPSAEEVSEAAAVMARVPRQPIALTCVRCGAPFTAKVRYALYCSPKCKTNAKYHRNPAHFIALQQRYDARKKARAAEAALAGAAPAMGQGRGAE